MCPSYQATREEKDSTRGRARVLQEMINGEVVQLGWKSPAVHRALDLCLSCKGCARDCPTGIDMAAYKAQVLDHTYRRQLRPRSHYALGWLPRWGRLITRLASCRPAGQSEHRDARAAQRWSGGAPVSTSAGRCRGSPRSRRAERVAAAGARGRPGDHLGGLVLRLLHRGRRRGGRLGAGGGWLRTAAPGTTRLLRPDLDQHRSARRRPTAAARGTGHPASRTSRRERRSSAWSRPASRSGAATRPNCCPTIRGSPRSRPASSPWPSCWRVRRTGRRPT